MRDSRRRARLRLTATAVLACAGLAPAADATYPGEDGAIAFNSYGSRQDILVMKPDGSDVRNLTQTCKRRERLVDWSPDGSRLAYFSLEGNAGGIARMDGEGGNVTDVTALPLETKPAWSPDGTKLLFTDAPSEGVGYTDIFVVNVDGSGRTNLTNTPDLAESGGAWSPDGTKIVFSSQTGGPAESLLFTMDPTGGNRAQLSQSGGVIGTGDLSPDWSPDGSRIVFRRATNPPSNMGSEGIYVIPAGGGDPVPLLGPGPVTSGLGFPSWSPSGTRIVYQGPGDGEVWTMDADGTGQTRLNREKFSAPDWGSSLTYGGVAGECEDSAGGGGSSAFGGYDLLRAGIRWALSCRAPESVASACAAKLTLSTRGRRRGGRAAAVVGSTTASIPTGKSRNVVVKLRRPAKQLLRRRGRLAVRARAVVSYGEGAQAVRQAATRAVTLQAPKRR